MKFVFLTATLLGATGLSFAGDPAPVTYVDAAKVAVALEKGGALAKGDDFTVSGAIPRSFAISLFDLPWPIRSRTALSRALNKPVSRNAGPMGASC